MTIRKLLPATIGLAVALAVAPVLAQQDAKKSDSYLADARKSLQKGDLKKAIIELKNAVQANPANLAARYELGIAQLAANDLLSAEKELKIVKEKNFTEKDVSVPLAELYLRQRKFDAIVAEILPGERATAEEAVVRLARGYALFAVQRREEAEKSLQDALSLAPNPSRAQTALARVKASSGDFEGALDFATKATQSDPKSTEAWLTLSEVHAARRESGPARDAVTRAVELNPNDLRFRISRARLLISQNELQLAQSDINAALKADAKNPSANYLDAVIQARQQNWRGAEMALQRMGTAVGRFPPALFLEASVKIGQGSLAQAEDSINRYLALLPADPSGSMLLSNLLVRRNALPRAVEVLKASAEKNPKDIRVLAALSDAYIRNKQPEQADAVLDQLSALSPSDATFRTQLAAQRLRLGQADEAIADLEAASELNPKSSSAGILLVLTNLQANKLEDAEKAAEALRERQPTNPVTENLLGVISLRKQDLAAARAHFESALKIKNDFTPAVMNIAQLERLERRPQKAREIYASVVEKEPGNESALTGLADLSLAEQQPEEAIQWLEKARAGNPKSVTTRLRLVELYLSRKEPPKAIAAAREAVTIAPQESRTQNALGVALLANGETESAMQALRRAVDVDPNSSEAQFQLARAYIGQKDFKAARGWLEKALQGNLANLDMQQRYLEFAVAAQEVDAAVAYARKTSLERPGDPAAELLLGGALEIAGKPEDATTLYERGLARGENVIFLNRLAGVYTRTNQPEKAVGVLQTWLGKHANDDRARFQLGTLYISMEKYDDAVREHEAMLKAAPNNVIVLNNLAWLYDVRKDERALDFAERAYGISPAPVIADTLAWILVRKGENARALGLLEKAVSEMPNQPSIRYHYSVALKNAGKATDARRELEGALKNEAALGADLEAAKQLLKELGG